MTVVEPLGHDMDLYFGTPHHPHLVARVPARPGLSAGQEVSLQADLSRCHIFDPSETGQNLSLAEPEQERAVA